MQLLRRMHRKQNKDTGHNKEDGTACMLQKMYELLMIKMSFNEQLIHYKEESEYDNLDFQEPSDMSTINFVSLTNRNEKKKQYKDKTIRIIKLPPR